MQLREICDRKQFCHICCFIVILVYGSCVRPMLYIQNKNRTDIFIIKLQLKLFGIKTY